MIEKPRQHHRAVVALLALAGLAAGCSVRHEPAVAPRLQRHWFSTSQPSPADDYLAAEIGHLAAEDQMRSAQNADRPPKARHRDSAMRRPRRAR